MKFFDTNILVYVADIRDPQKQRIAENLVMAALGSGDVLISEQVLNEFSSIALSLALPRVWRKVKSDKKRR